MGIFYKYTIKFFQWYGIDAINFLLKSGKGFRN